MFVIPLLKKATPFLLFAVIVAAAYDGWIFYSRWADGRSAERASQAKEAEDARKSIELMGGGEFRILNFYGNPATMRRGSQANLCYGVFGAKTVRIEPPVEKLHPALAHCFQVTPAKTTEYMLSAEDGAGHTASQPFTLTVTP